MGAYGDAVGCWSRTGALAAAAMATAAAGGCGVETVEKGVTPRATSRLAALRKSDGRGIVKASVLPIIALTSATRAAAPHRSARCRGAMAGRRLRG